MFELHPRLAADTEWVADLPLCTVLLAKDGLYPWVILVPRRSDIQEVYQLDANDQQQLSRESVAVASTMAGFFDAAKMNIAALGNQVPQLHLHHIVRYKNDAAWPNPVWGAVPAKPYEAAALDRRLTELKTLFADLDV